MNRTKPLNRAERAANKVAQRMPFHVPDKIPFNCITALLAVIPTVFMTLGSHYFKHGKYKESPKRHIGYHEGLDIIDAFLYYASLRTVEEMQAFTSQKISPPGWAKVIIDTIPDDIMRSAANLVINQLGQDGLNRVGGKKWWQWRGHKDTALGAEWIETMHDFEERKRIGDTGTRIVMYVHGGAYYFGSVNSHRYQILRHARMLKARCFAPEYRLAPQFPFPCALQDVIASYVYLLALYSPKEIVVMGDSAGAGLLLSMLVTLRDQKMPLPSGSILISPWVDLTASFPSMGQEAPDDFLPPYGLMQAPSILFPPPNCDDIEDLMAQLKNETGQQPHVPPGTTGGNPGSTNAQPGPEAVQGYGVQQEQVPAAQGAVADHPRLGRRIPPLTATVANETVEIKDQIWTYTTNDMLAHPLVSPVFQPSLGGLPQMLVICGSGERLRDEQIYVAHKAARPSKYKPDEDILSKYDPTGRVVSGYPPTDVFLQVYDGLCHEALSLSYAWPVKCMNLSIAQFAAKCLAEAQQTVVDIPDPLFEEREKHYKGSFQWGRVGDDIPPYENHMIRQRVHYNGSIYPMEPEESMQALNLPATEMGRIQSTVAVNWLAAKRLWDSRFRNRRRKLQKQHVKELRMNVQLFDPSELPPACSAASRYGLPVPKLKVPRGGHILTVWASIGSKFDKKAIQRRRAHMKQLRVGTEVPRPEAGRRRSSTVISGLEGHRRSRASAYGIFPEGSGPARPARRPSSVAARGQSRGASPKRLASIDMGAAGAGATMSTAGVASVATGSTTSAMSMARRRESSIQPPALMQADNFVFANRLSPQQEVSEPTSSYPTSPGAQRRVPPSDAAIRGQQSPSPRESDVSPGSVSPRQLEEEEKVNAAREHYNSIRPPASPPQDDADQPRRSPGIDDESPNTPSDEYMRRHSQRFPNYASNAGEQRGYGEEGYGGYGAASPGRDAEREPSPFKVDETGIAVGDNGENTGTTSTRAIIDQSGVISPGKHENDAPGDEQRRTSLGPAGYEPRGSGSKAPPEGEQRRTSLGPAGYEPRESGSKLPPAGGIGSRLEPNYITRPEESPMIPPKAPTRAAQARREAEARMPGVGKPSIVDQADQEATATKIKRDSGVGVRDPDDVSPSTDVPRSKSGREQAGLKERLGLD